MISIYFMPFSLTRVLLHVVKPPLPVHLHVHLLTFFQRRAHKVQGFGTLPRHPQHRDVSNEPMVIWLKEDNTKPVKYLCDP